MKIKYILLLLLFSSFIVNCSGQSSGSITYLEGNKTFIEEPLFKVQLLGKWVEIKTDDNEYYEYHNGKNKFSVMLFPTAKKMTEEEHQKVFNSFIRINREEFLKRHKNKIKLNDVVYENKLKNVLRATFRGYWNESIRTYTSIQCTQHIIYSFCYESFDNTETGFESFINTLKTYIKSE